MKFKSKLATVLFGTAVLTGSAQAAIDNGSAGFNNAGAGGSDLFFLATWTTGPVESQTVNTYVQDLNIGFNEIVSSPSPYSFAGIPSITEPGYTWTILATDNDIDGTGTDASAYGPRFLATSTSGNPVYDSGSDFEVGQSASSIFNSLSGFNGALGAGDSATVQGESGAGTWASVVTTNSGVFQSAAVTGQTGDALDFFLYGQTGDVVSGGFFGDSFVSDGAYATLLGTWALSTAGALTYSAIPVPAAVWLFGSALLGLVGVSRRKQQLVVA